MINWTITKEDNDIAVNIAKRAILMARKLGVKYSQMDAVMDIEACHNNGCTLKLSELLEADDFNFAHDIFGIRRHINRNTGKLEHCFLPRFSKPS